MPRSARSAAQAAAALLICFLAALAASSPAAAKDLPLETFFGTFKGTGVAENNDSLYFGVTVRDLDVVIQKEGEGFAVEWSTVIRRGGDPNNPKVRRKSQRMTFMPAGRPNVWASPDNADPIQGSIYGWARIEEQSLITYLVSIAENGSYDIQSYRRTLTPSGMEFTFRRTQDGEPVRSVNGKLIRYGQ